MSDLEWRVIVKSYLGSDDSKAERGILMFRLAYCIFVTHICTVAAVAQQSDGSASHAATELTDLLARKAGPKAAVRWLLDQSKGDPWAAAIAACLLQDPPAGWVKYDELSFRKLYRPPAEAERALGIVRDAWTQKGRERDNAAAVTLFRFAAERNVVGAAVDLADHLAIGLGVEQNSAESIHWLTRAANNRDPLAMRKLGSKYLMGEDVLPDPVAAVKWFRAGAEAGDTECMPWLANMLSSGRVGVEKNPSDAELWAQRAANAGNTAGMAILAKICLLKQPPDDKAAFAWASRAAQEGDASGMLMLAALYSVGRGCEANEPKSVHWMRNAAMAGSSEAMNRLAEAYSNGEGVAPSESIDLDAATREASNGNASAMAVLAMSYHHGRGVAKNRSEGFKWLRQAAEAGHAMSMLWTAQKYKAGDGVPQDDVAAVNWYRKAALGGQTAAQSQLLVLYSGGKGVRADESSVVLEVQAEAERGNANAMFVLGLTYFGGRGVERSPTLAVKWLKKGAERGNVEAMVGMAMAARTEADKITWWRRAAQLGDELAKEELKKRRLSTVQNDVKTAESPGSKTTASPARFGGTIVLKCISYRVDGFPSAGPENRSVPVKFDGSTLRFTFDGNEHVVSAQGELCRFDSNDRNLKHEIKMEASDNATGRVSVFDVSANQLKVIVPYNGTNTTRFTYDDGTITVHNFPINGEWKFEAFRAGKEWDIRITWNHTLRNPVLGGATIGEWEGKGRLTAVR